MGRSAGFIALHASMASRDANITLIPEAPWRLSKLLEWLEERLRLRGHAVIVVAEGAESVEQAEARLARAGEAHRDASGNVLPDDVGLYLRDSITAFFKARGNPANIKYIDPSYIIRSSPPCASDSNMCSNLAFSACCRGGRWAHSHVPEILFDSPPLLQTRCTAQWQGTRASPCRPLTVTMSLSPSRSSRRSRRASLTSLAACMRACAPPRGSRPSFENSPHFHPARVFHLPAHAVFPAQPLPQAIPHIYVSRCAPTRRVRRRVLVKSWSVHIFVSNHGLRTGSGCGTSAAQRLEPKSQGKLGESLSEKPLSRCSGGGPDSESAKGRSPRSTAGSAALCLSESHPSVTGGPLRAFPKGHELR